VVSKVLKDRLDPKKRENGKNEWSFRAPSYDNRTSCSISAGNDYGIGVTQPIGSKKVTSIKEGPIQMSPESFSPHEIFGKYTGKVITDKVDKKG
jgi:hypothetical protein